MAVVRLVPPVGGVAPPSGSQAVPKDKAQILQNFLVDEPGRLAVRGPFGNPVSLFAAGQTLTGIWTFGENFLAEAFVGAAGATHFDTAGGIATPVAPAASTLLSGRSARLGDYAYGPSTTAATLLLRWNGTAASPGTLTNTPTGSAAVAAHLERIFVAGGKNPDGSGVALNNTIWWTDPGGPTAGTLAQWQDDVSGLVNQVAVGDDGDRIIALVPFNRQLLVFKRNSIWTVLGDRPDNFTVRRLVSNLGCSNPAAVLVADDLCLFVSTNGVPMMYDGDTILRLYGCPLPLATGFSGRIARLSDDYFLFTDGGSSSLFYLPNRAWSEVTTSGVFTVAAGELCTTEQGAPYITDGKDIRSLSGLTTFGNGTEQDAAAAATMILPRVQYRLEELSVPLYGSVLRRAIVDHKLHKSGGAGTGTWTVTLQDSTNTTLSTVSVPSAAATTLVRSVSELYGEASDVAVNIALAVAGAASTFDAASLQDVWIEHEPAQRR